MATIPSPRWTAESERLGGRLCHTLFELTVTHPVPKTWYLATVDLAPPEFGMFDPFVFDPGTFATGWGGEVFLGLVREHSGVAASAAIGGQGGQAGVTLTLINALGTGGPGRKFMDVFVTNVPGYAEPYDLHTMTLRCALLWADLLGEPLVVGASLHLQPEGLDVSVSPGEPEAVTLAFGPDQRRYRTLPRTILTTRRYAHLPDTVDGRPMPVWFGSGLRVACLPLDADGGLYGIGASPLVTPLAAVTKLWTLRPDPGSDASGPVALPARITTAGESVLALTGAGTAVTVTQIAQRLELEGTGAFVYAVRLWLRRQSAGSPAIGSLSISVVLDQDGLPGTVLVDSKATAEINAAIVSTGVFAPYDIPFSANVVSRPAFLPAGRGLWVILKYAKTSGGDLQLDVDGTGAYAKGMLATKAAGTDDEWILVGKQQRRGPVKLDFTGIGYLRRDAATGAIVVRPPVTVPGS